MSPFHLVGLVPMLPLLAALAVAALMLANPSRGEAGERLTARISFVATGLSGLLLLALDLAALANGAAGQVRFGDWFASGEFRAPLSFTVDALSLGFATLVGFLGLVTLKFSVAYLHREAGFHRFFLGMNLFIAGMQFIVLAGNPLLAFIGWEFCGFSSWLLIGYAYQRRSASGNAQRAFLTNRVGDAGFVLGIALAFLWLGSLDWAELADGAGRLTTLNVSLIALGFATAALAKSAQVPFSFWIARALEGPTPSSAIFYGAVMVHAGVYLIIRLQPVLTHAPGVMALLALLGLATALYGWLVGYVQTDIKSALLHSTLAQVGLMFLACGFGLFDVAAWHMALHAVWRTWQFLAAPGYMHMVDAPAPPAPTWLTPRQRLYVAVQQRFWLEALADRLFTRPTQALARDVRAFDDNVVSRLAGMPESRRAATLLDPDTVVSGKGLAGKLLMWTAARFGAFERHLLLQGGNGRLGTVLRHLGQWLRRVEDLLEQPRYLLLMLMATLLVIL